MNDIKKISIWIALIGCLIAALYGQFLHNPIVFDDLYVFMLDNDGHSAVEQFANPNLYDLRALPYITLAWNAHLFGFDLPPFRIENLLLHWFVVIALALFVLRLYRAVLLNLSVRGEPVEPLLPSTSSGRTVLDATQANTGMMTAVLVMVSLFALHPVAVYATGYLVQRSIVMATLFSVLTLTAYLKGSSGGNKGWLWASVFLYFMATHNKEHVIMLPAVIVAMTVLVHEDWRAHLRRNWMIFAAYAVIGLLTLYQIRSAVGHAYEINAGEMFEGKIPEYAFFYSVLTQTWLFFKYGLLWLLPNPAWMSVDMREPFAQSVFSGYGAALLAYLLYGFVALRLLLKRGQRGLIGFALLFPWLMFATEFSTVRVQEIFVLYRSYIWAVGGVILLPLALMRFNARLTLLLSVLFAATLFMISMERLASFSNPILLWDDAEKLVKDRPSLPGVGRIYYNRGTEWMKAGMLDKALPDLQKATHLSPEWAPAFDNLGVLYSKLGQRELAIQAYSRAIDLDQQKKSVPKAEYYYNRAREFDATGQHFKAILDYKVSCLLNGKMGCDKTDLSLKP